MTETTHLPTLPIDWLEEAPVPKAGTAEYDFRPGDAQLTISWPVTADSAFQPEIEALTIASLLEQAQGFTRAFQLANLSRMRLFYQDGTWLPVAAPLPAPVVGPHPGTNGQAAPPEAKRQPEPEETITSFTHPALAEDWTAVKERLRGEQEVRRAGPSAPAAGPELRERLLRAQQPSGMAVPTVPGKRETLDEAIERAEEEGRLLPTQPKGKLPKKQRNRPKHALDGTSPALVDQVYRLLRKVGRPVDANYVTRQFDRGYESIRRCLVHLEQEGLIDKIPREKVTKGGSWHDYQVKER